MAARTSAARSAATVKVVEQHEPGGGQTVEGPADDSPAAVFETTGLAAAEPLEAVGTTARVGFAPIVRVDADRREVELCATSEAVDSYGTVFDYEASKDAFTRWLGNVREMHERRAVGRRVGVRCDDAERRIYVRVRISRGAEDTWEKVLDGTLRGASIGASNVAWARRVRNIAGRERQLQVATRYDLVELSLVDNPSNPDALGITLVRDAVPDVALLDDLSPSRGGEQENLSGETSGRPPDASTARQGTEPHTRAAGAAAMPEAELDELVRRGTLCRLLKPGAPDGQERARGPFSPNAEGYPDVGVPERAEERPTSALGAGPDGNARERFHTAARAILMGCGCLLCGAALAALGTDGPSADAARAAGTIGDTREGALARALAAGLGASVARLDQMEASVRGLGATVESLMGSAVKSAMRTVLERAASETDALRERIEALEAQPLPGGPVLRVAEKTHPLLGQGSGMGTGGQPGPAEQFRALESLAGRLTDPNAQMAVAAEMIRLQRGD